MSAKIAKHGKIKRPSFPRKLTPAQRKQIQDAPLNTDLIEKVMQATKNIVFVKQSAFAS